MKDKISDDTSHIDSLPEDKQESKEGKIKLLDVVALTAVSGGSGKQKKMEIKIVNTKKIKATYRNGVIEPLNKINLPEGQELEIELILPLKTSHELSREEKKN